MGTFYRQLRKLAGPEFARWRLPTIDFRVGFESPICRWWRGLTDDFPDLPVVMHDAGVWVSQ